MVIRPSSVLAAAAAALFFAPSVNAQSQSAIAAAYGGVTPPQCFAANVDLSNISACRCVIPSTPFVRKGQTMIRARDTCGDAIEKQAIAGQVDLGVSAAPSPVRGGSVMTVVISIKNTSSAPVPVVVRDAPWLQNALGVRNASGAEVARAGPCGEGFSGSMEIYLVVLPPGGVAQWRLPWVASTRATDSACSVSWRPFAAGNYALSVPLQLPQHPSPIARGTMTVQ